MWFFYMLGVLSLATVTCLYLHQQTTKKSTEQFTTNDENVNKNAKQYTSPFTDMGSMIDSGTNDSKNQSDVNQSSPAAYNPAIFSTTNIPPLQYETVPALRKGACDNTGEEEEQEEGERNGKEQEAESESEDQEQEDTTDNSDQPVQSVMQTSSPARETASSPPSHVFTDIPLTEHGENGEDGEEHEEAGPHDPLHAYHPSPYGRGKTVDEPGYVYLPSSFWSVPQKRPPACTPGNAPKVCPVYTDGVPEDALEWKAGPRERQIRTMVKPPDAKHETDKDLQYYYKGYYAKKEE